MDIAAFAASLHGDLPTIDLHGITPVQRAIDRLERDLYRFYENGDKTCRVIYGIGEGVMAKHVQAALDKNPMVHEWHHEQTGGSCIVVL